MSAPPVRGKKRFVGSQLRPFAPRKEHLLLPSRELRRPPETRIRASALSPFGPQISDAFQPPDQRLGVRSPGREVRLLRLLCRSPRPDAAGNATQGGPKTRGPHEVNSMDVLDMRTDNKDHFERGGDCPIPSKNCMGNRCHLIESLYSMWCSFNFGPILTRQWRNEM